MCAPEPELQQASLTSCGTRDFSQQRPLGPWMPGLTQVQAWQRPSPPQLLRQTNQEAAGKFV
jgi:hypothetical protein